jgi:limonene-1,2-epoxide hydrolase
MSDRDQELIATVRHFLDAAGRGDFDSAVENADPDVELVTIDGLTNLRGAAAFRAWMEPTTVELVSTELEHVEVAGSNVLTRHLNRARGVTSGISNELRFWTVWTFNERGLVTRIVGFRDEQEAKARQAAGLSE